MAILMALLAFGSLSTPVPAAEKAITFRDFMIMSGSLLAMLVIFNVVKTPAAPLKICPKCGTNNLRTATICVQCGQQLGDVTTTTVQGVATPIQYLSSPQMIVGIVCMAFLVNSGLLDKDLTGFFALTGAILVIKTCALMIWGFIKARPK